MKFNCDGYVHIPESDVDGLPVDALSVTVKGQKHNNTMSCI
jgi:hypothetical protein